jgi:hypothetical protein
LKKLLNDTWYNRKDIEKNLLPVYQRIRKVPLAGNPWQRTRHAYLVAADGTILTRELDPSWVAYLSDVINHIVYEKTLAHDDDTPNVIIGATTLHTNAFMAERRLIIREDEEGRPYITPSDEYLRMIKSFKRKIMADMSASKYAFPFKGNVSLQAVFTVNRLRKPPRLSDLLNAMVDIIITCGIIVNDRQVVSFDGSRIVVIKKAKPKVELLIRTWK